MTTTIRAIAFDAIETCLSLDAIAPHLVEVGLEPRDLDLWFAQALRTAFALEVTGEFRPFKTLLAETLGGLARRRGANPGVDRLNAVIERFRSLPMHPDVAPAFEHARRGGAKLAILTNGSIEVTRAAFAAAQLESQVEMFVSVDEVQRFKPAREVYALAASRLGEPPESVALVAAHDWDVHGAKAAGLRAGFVRRRGAHMPGFMRAPDAEGDSLPEVVSALLSS